MREMMLSRQFGFRTVVVKHPVWRIWLGYVALPKSHPLYGLSYDAINDFVSVHGGLTYAGDHLPDGRKSPVWWVGFDTGHAGDVVPGMDSLPEDVKARIKAQAQQFVAALFDMNVEDLPEEEPGEYRDREFVLSEVAYLASQLSVNNLMKEV